MHDRKRGKLTSLNYRITPSCQFKQNRVKWMKILSILPRGNSFEFLTKLAQTENQLLSKGEKKSLFITLIRLTISRVRKRREGKGKNVT